MSKELYQADIVPGLVTLTSNTKKIPHCPLVSVDDISTSTLPKNQHDHQYKIEYRVKRISSPLTGYRDKTYKKIAQNKIYFERPIGPVRAKMVAEFNSDHIRLVFNPIYVKISKASIDQFYSPGHQLMDVINWALLNSGYSLLHSAAFEYKNKGVVLIGLSNTGKTSTTLEFISNHDSTYLAEDISVTNGSEVYSCPYSLSPINPKIIGNRSNQIYSKIDDYIPLLDRVYRGPIKTIVDVVGENNIGTSSGIDHIFVLTKGDRFEESLNSEKAKSLILSSNRAEFTYSANQLLWAAQYLDIIDVSEAVTTESEIITSMIENTNTHHVGGGTEDFVNMIQRTISAD